MRSLVLLLVLASASWATALAQDTPTMVAAKKAVANKAVVASANAKVAAVKANIAPCSDLATVEKMLPICDVALPETRDSAECRALLKGAGSSDLEVGRIRGASFLLPAGAKEGKLVKLGGTGHGGMFNGAIAPADFTKPVGYTVRAFDGAAPLGERIALRVKDSSALGTSDNLAGGIVGLLTEQCGEIKVQPGSRVVCGICLLATDNIKSVSVSPDPSNAGVVSLPLADGDTQLGAIVSGAAGAARGAGALAAALAGLVVAAAAML